MEGFFWDSSTAQREIVYSKNCILFVIAEKCTFHREILSSGSIYSIVRVLFRQLIIGLLMQNGIENVTP